MKCNFYIKTFSFSVGLLLTTTLPAFAAWNKAVNNTWINEPWLIERTGTLIPLNTPKNIKGITYYCPESTTPKPQYGFLPFVKQVFRGVTEVLQPNSIVSKYSVCFGESDYSMPYAKTFIMDVKPITQGVQVNYDIKATSGSKFFNQHWFLSGYVKQTVQTNGLNGLCTKSFYTKKYMKQTDEERSGTTDPVIIQKTLPNQPCSYKPDEKDYQLLWDWGSQQPHYTQAKANGKYAPCGGTNLIHEQFLPITGPGYILKANTDPEHQYGISTTINTVRQIAASWTKTYPTRPIRMGDLSLKCGIDTKEHDGHQTGKEWDIGLFWKDGRNAGGINYKLDTFDRVLTQALINRLIAHPRITRVIFNDPLITGNSKLTRDRPGKPPVHHDHIHVEFK